MKKHSKYLKYFPLLALYIAVTNSQSVYAMHIMEGFGLSLQLHLLFMVLRELLKLGKMIRTKNYYLP